MSYLENAKKEMQQLANILDTWFISNRRSIYALADTIDHYNRKNKTHFRTCHGAVRMVIMGKDYVVKIDYSPFHAACYGGCRNEWKAYNDLKNDEYGYLLCPVNKIKIGHHFYYCMPKVDYVGEECDYNLDDYLCAEEEEWIYDNFDDLHNGNWGVLHGQAVLIDYAYRRG